MSWHTDRKIGEVALLPNGTRVRIVWVRGKKVRLEYLDPRKGTNAFEGRDVTDTSASTTASAATSNRDEGDAP